MNSSVSMRDRRSHRRGALGLAAVALALVALMRHRRDGVVNQGSEHRGAFRGLLSRFEAGGRSRRGHFGESRGPVAMHFEEANDASPSTGSLEVRDVS
jgi:hypothetical protein